MKRLHSARAAVALALFAGVLLAPRAAHAQQTRWYLAEGSTGPFFEEEVLAINPTDQTASGFVRIYRDGTFIGNASIVLGKRWFGLAGSFVAFLGLFGPPFVWVLAMAILYSDIATSPLARSIVTGVGAAGAGLFIGTAIKLARALVEKRAALAIIAACFLAIGLARLSLFVVLPVVFAAALLLARKGRV